MDDEFQRGLITGLAMLPLSVSVSLSVSDQSSSGGESENFCAVTALSGGVQSDEGFCEYIEF